MGLIQEKFQTVAPDPHNEEQRDWMDSAAARRSTPEYKSRVTESSNSGVLNCLPPGDNITEQYFADIHPQPFSMGGETDVSADWNKEAVTKGFKRLDVKPTDDAYTSEHVDTFYGEAKVGSDVGFCERGNVLDRI